ncbi:death-associated protein 1 isoform X1 [Gallus gallus]|uniref:death-associated protein 1 isoform X1 n=1 Tax=Gallus gallus TaxID=9031 RepID=UPI001F0203AC|nr:death-associated protein 1 isoform X1 [Gallus gallus]
MKILPYQLLQLGAGTVMVVEEQGDCFPAGGVTKWLIFICVCFGELHTTVSPPKPTVFISGVIARGDKDFPPAAAQVAHQKPHPSVEKLPHPQHVKQHIHQPRK